MRPRVRERACASRARRTTPPAGTPFACACAIIAALSALSGCGNESPRPAIHGAAIAIVLEDFVQVPASSTSLPRARINSMIAAPDGSHRLFVNDMVGKIYIVQDRKIMNAPFLDMAVARKDAFTSEDLFEQGLNTFAFHPDFARIGQPGYGRLYTFSTERVGSGKARHALANQQAAHHDVVAEWRLDARNANRVDPESRRELLRIAHPLHDHVGGQIAFSPRAQPGSADYGMLYIGVGDGGNTVPRSHQVDAWRTAQDKSLPFGKLLRINPLGATDIPYTVPSDNPFVNERGALGEIWALGLRNPSRFSWDSAGDGKLLIADIGQTQLEEINVGQAGANYGWSQREGMRLVRHADERQRGNLPLYDRLLGFTYPAVSYGHHVGFAVTGGFVYRGTALPVLTGMYVFGDVVNGRVFATAVEQLQSGRQAPMYELRFSYGGMEQTLLQILRTGRADLRIAVDERGEMYLLSKQDGTIRRFAGTVASETGTWPLEHPTDPLDDATVLQRVAAPLGGTVSDVLERLKTLSQSRPKR
ncbi:MAG: PQQ-dependent sugar dehydrogenase [Pseudomonadota bacterium]|nr:PQQ-dependent sugar dehydrogenase [Pseudomonadota bacterium]